MRRTSWTLLLRRRNNWFILRYLFLISQVNNRTFLSVSEVDSIHLLWVPLLLLSMFPINSGEDPRGL